MSRLVSKVSPDPASCTLHVRIHHRHHLGSILRFPASRASTGASEGEVSREQRSLRASSFPEREQPPASPLVDDERAITEQRSCAEMNLIERHEAFFRVHAPRWVPILEPDSQTTLVRTLVDHGTPWFLGPSFGCPLRSPNRPFVPTPPSPPRRHRERGSWRSAPMGRTSTSCRPAAGTNPGGGGGSMHETSR